MPGPVGTIDQMDHSCSQERPQCGVDVRCRSNPPPGGGGQEGFPGVKEIVGLIRVVWTDVSRLKTCKNSLLEKPGELWLEPRWRAERQGASGCRGTQGRFNKVMVFNKVKVSLMGGRGRERKTLGGNVPPPAPQTPPSLGNHVVSLLGHGHLSC